MVAEVWFIVIEVQDWGVVHKHHSHCSVDRHTQVCAVRDHKGQSAISRDQWVNAVVVEGVGEHLLELLLGNKGVV